MGGGQDQNQAIEPKEVEHVYCHCLWLPFLKQYLQIEGITQGGSVNK